MTASAVATSVRAVDRGRVVASLLQGAWRAVPGSTSISEEQLEAVLPVLTRSGTAALAWRRIRDTPLAATKPGRRLLMARRIQAAEAAIRLEQIQQLFSQDGMQEVAPILIKGFAHSRFYPEPAVRYYTDIDFLVEPKRYEAAVTAAGMAVPRDPARAIPVDIQDSWMDLPERSWEQLFARSELLPLRAVKVRVLGLEDSLRLSCLHLLRHLGFHPLWLCDVSALVENLPSDFDWEYCLSGQSRRTDWMLAAIRLANELLGARTDACPPRRLPRTLPAWMVTAILRWWGAEATFTHPWPLPGHIISVVRANPRQVPQALVDRWPDPLQAIGRYSWPINRLSGMVAPILDFTTRALMWGPRQFGFRRRTPSP